MLGIICERGGCVSESFELGPVLGKGTRYEPDEFTLRPSIMLLPGGAENVEATNPSWENN